VIATPEAHQVTFAGGIDAFLVKFNTAGQRLWGTYYGGDLTDRSGNCAADTNENIYMTSYRTNSTNNISTPGSHQPTSEGPGTHQITYTYTNFALCSDVGYLMLDARSASPFSCGNDLLDIRDSTVYPTVLTGTQCWMAANLAYGTEISHTTPQ